MSRDARLALEELDAALAEVDDAALDAAAEMVAAARRIVLYGCGREGLQMRGLCMRLFHLGCDVAMVGDMTTPPVGPGDLFMVSAGPGELSTARALMQVTRAAGASVLLVTAQPQAPLAALADRLLVIPAQTMATDRGPGASALLPMGSLFEGAMFVVFEILVLRLRGRLGETAESMRARHTNME